MKDEDRDLAGVYVARAMFALAASCEPPALRPDCPYSVALAGGVRTCEEQCRDILLRHGIKPPGPELVPLVTPATPPGPRAFDASERYLHERGRHMSRWSVSALLWALRQHLTRTPVGVAGPGDPERETGLCLAELTRRGFDVEALVRLGLGEDISQALTVVAVMPALPSTRPSAMPSTDATAFPATSASVQSEREGWVSLLDEVLAAEEQEPGAGDLLPFPDEVPGTGLSGFRRRVHGAIQGSFQQRLRAWVATAPLRDIVAWTAPSSAAFKATALVPEPLAARREEARWTVERFTEPYYEKWSPTSLHLEFRWSRDLRPGCCDAQFMAERTPQRLELAETIAAAAASRPAGHEFQRSLLKAKAIELLTSGQRGAAAALLDASRHLDDELPEPHSDYAFLILPDDPRAALRALDRARELGFDRTVSIGNRALCLALLGDGRQGLAEAERVLAGYDREDTAKSYMWDPAAALTGRPGVMVEGVSPRDYVLDLGVLIAESIGDDLAAARWRDERERLRQRHAA